jgi:hypothetical protein
MICVADLQVADVADRSAFAIFADMPSFIPTAWRRVLSG